MRRLLSHALKTCGYAVEEVECGRALIDILQLQKTEGVQPSLIVSDYRMPHCTGLDVLCTVRKWGWTHPFILITAFGEEDIMNTAFFLGATIVIDKPFSIDDFITVVTSIIHEKQSHFV